MHWKVKNHAYFLNTLLFIFQNIFHTGIGRLRALQSLNLSNNQLKNLPVQLFECHNLLNLHLESNQLKFIPKEIVKLKNLSELTLSNNQLLFMIPNIWLIIENLKGDYSDNPLLFHLNRPDWIKKWPKFDTNEYMGFDALDEKTILLVIEKFKEYYNLQLVVKMGVPPLLELTMQKVFTDFLPSYRTTQECRQKLLRQLPKDIRSYFNTSPPCFCYRCKKPIFRWAIVCGFDSSDVASFKCSNKCTKEKKIRRSILL